MAELGHPVIGPQSLWKLTKGELRIYAEGMHVENERKELARAEAKSDSDTSLSHQKAKKKRDAQALQSIEEQMAGHDGDVGAQAP